MYKIGERFSRLAQIPVKTLRFYDDDRAAPPRSAQRKVTGPTGLSPEAFELLNRILVLKDAALSLRDIRAVLRDNIPLRTAAQPLRLKARRHRASGPGARRAPGAGRCAAQASRGGERAGREPDRRSARPRHGLSLRSARPLPPMMNASDFSTSSPASRQRRPEAAARHDLACLHGWRHRLLGVRIPAIANQRHGAHPRRFDPRPPVGFRLLYPR